MLLYDAVIGLAAPIVRRWGRLSVEGAHLLDGPGPILIVANHDSYWDPVVIGVAALHRRRIRALAKSTLWHRRALAVVLDGMGQLRITRGAANRGEIAAIVDVFEPDGGRCRQGESSIGLSRRVTAEIRDRAPATASGRHSALPQRVLEDSAIAQHP